MTRATDYTNAERLSCLQASLRLARQANALPPEYAQPKLRLLNRHQVQAEQAQALQKQPLAVLPADQHPPRQPDEGAQ